MGRQQESLMPTPSLPATPAVLAALGTHAQPIPGPSAAGLGKPTLLVRNAELAFKYFSDFMPWHLPLPQLPEAPGRAAEA